MSTPTTNPSKPGAKHAHTLRPAGTREYRVVLIQRGITTADVARMIGVESTTLATETAKDFPHAGVRRRIEDALAVRIWSIPREYTVRQVLRKHFGFDPHSRPRTEMIQKARELGATGIKARMHKEDAIEAIYQVLKQKQTNQK